MGQVRNDFGELRVMPTLDYSGVEPGRVLEIEDEDVYHWVAGGWTPLTRYPVPHRLYPNHRGDELAYALPEPDPKDPSAIAVGAPPEDKTPGPVPTMQGEQGPELVNLPAGATVTPLPAPAATAPTAAPETAPAAPAPAAVDAKE